MLYKCDLLLNGFPPPIEFGLFTEFPSVNSWPDQLSLFLFESYISFNTDYQIPSISLTSFSGIL